jgi:hypothetical protein
MRRFLSRRNDLNGIDVFFPARMKGLKSLLFQLVPTRYRAQKYNRQLRREIEERPNGALVVWERENSSQLYYVFHGMAGGLGIQPLTVLRETGLIHNNMVLLKDYYRFFYQAGLNPDTPDLNSTITRLQRCREELPDVRQTFCCGPSSGGYAAVLFGHYLEVDVVYAFAPVTLINLEDLKRFGGCKEMSRITEQHRDLARLLANHNGRTRYKIFYCEGHVRDRNYAERIRHLPGVELYPQPGTTHNVIEAIHQSGSLGQVFGDIHSEAVPS